MRVALFQCAPLPLGSDDPVAANLARLHGAAADAAAQGAGLLVCPEMFTTGYAIGTERARALAERRDGATAKAVARIARQHGLAIAYGYPERDGNEVFNAAQCIAADGAAIGHHRKTHLFGDLDRSMFSASSEGGAVFTLGPWRIGLLICYDVEFPENVRRLAVAGADVVLVPTANMQTFDFVATHLVPVRAYESQVVVAYANHCGSEGDVVYGGLSCIVTADGRDAARARRVEQLLVADLDHAALMASRAAFPYLADLRAASAHDAP